MKFWNSIRFKLAFGGVCLVAAISVCVFWIVTNAEESLIGSTFDSETASLCESVAQNVLVALNHDDFSALPRSAQWLRQYPDLESVIITDTVGNPLVRVPDGAMASSRGTPIPGSHRSNGRVEHCASIQGFGFLIVVRSLSRLDRQMASVRQRALAASLLFVLIGSVSIWFLSGRMVTPLRSLSMAAETLAEGHYNRVTIPRSRDEVSQLATHFNLMVNEVERRTEEREAANRSLASEIDVRRKTEAALTASEARLRMVISNVPIVLFALDSTGVITLAECKGLVKLQRDTSDLLGCNAWDVLPGHTRFREFTLRALAGEAFTAELSVGVSTFDIFYNPSYSKQGTVSGVIGLAVDISERKRAEQEAASLQERLVDSQKMEAIGSLAGGIAHDFNNLLVGMMGHASLLLQAPPSSDQVNRSSDAILKAAQRASSLTQQLLGFARKGTFQRQALDAHEAVKEVCQLLNHTIEKNINVQLELHANRAHFLADPNQVQQILMNLALNARDAMPNGGNLTFETQDIACAPPDCGHPEELAHAPYLSLSVSDTGSGIPEETLPHIFEPFFTTKAPGKGTGMGLAMVYGIVQSHRGLIRAHSERGRGTTFTIFFPACDAPRRQVIEPEARATTPTKGTVLVIDDEDVVRNLLVDLLAAVGCTTLTAATAIDGIRTYQERRGEIDVVILDMLMPGMDGSECFRRLREIDSEVRVIISSGYTRNDSVQLLIDNGAVGFIGKPYTIRELTDVIRVAITAPRQSSSVGLKTPGAMS